ncbi:MAG: ABC transporter substrate-binding protein [Nitrospirae bacterium]|nr:ABC transporter substrate-binding protein [Magnetococcales bacterium]
MVSLLLVWSLLGLNGPLAAVARGAETMGVGVLLPLTGPMALFGKAAKQSYEMAMDQINDQGGIQGKTLRFLFADTKSQAQRGKQLAVDWITQGKVVALAGGMDPPVASAMAEVSVLHAFPVVIHASMTDQRAIIACDPGPDHDQRSECPVFRISPAMEESMVTFEDFLTRVVRPQSMAILYEDSPFGADAMTQLEKIAKRLGIPDPYGIVFASNTTAIIHAWDQVRPRGFDLIVMVSSTRSAERLVLGSMSRNLNPKLFVGIGRGFNHPRFMENVGKAGEKLMTVTVWHPGIPPMADQNYADLFLERTNTESQVDGAQAYATAWVIKDGLERAVSLSKEDIINALVKTELPTILGPVTFTRQGDQVNQNPSKIYLAQWLGNKRWIVWPQNLASRGYVYPIDWIRERR